jgi:hypothetical protein
MKYATHYKLFHILDRQNILQLQLEIINSEL